MSGSSTNITVDDCDLPDNIQDIVQKVSMIDCRIVILYTLHTYQLMFPRSDADMTELFGTDNAANALCEIGYTRIPTVADKKEITARIWWTIIV